ncbi:MAG: DivIVA domain-containing protein [Corallococcus sp.]|nr:DivIVA domain-containing protein [Corallococcus sp.]
MKFDIKMRGYDREQVDNYLLSTQQRYDEVMRTQKERIFALVDENARLQEELKQYRLNERAISQSLVESQKLAEELKTDAEKFSQIALQRAKVFYATWQSYAKTILSGMSSDEVKQFNLLARKIEKVMHDYEGESKTAATVAAYESSCPVNPRSNEAYKTTVEKSLAEETPTETNVTMEQQMPQVHVNQVQKPAEALNDDKLVNPIEKVANASGNVIDLKELLKPEESLEDLCADLGLINK